MRYQLSKKLYMVYRDWKKLAITSKNYMFGERVKQIAHDACFLLFSYQRQTRQCVFHVEHNRRH